ncbi:TldD/PmbA family protein [Candidatus Thorarchaeota archaeon]|nr:MAG: TldD/PmbA family protein [Candidatus Thorarchaeota archaeon]
MNFDDIKDELLSVTDSGLKYAKSLDSSTDFEIYLFFQNKVKAEIDQGIVSASDGALAGTAVRAAKDKRIGFAVASGVTTDRVRFAVKEALSIIQTVKVEDNRFKSFAEPKPPSKEGYYSDDILALHTDDLIKSCEVMIEEARVVDPRVKVISASAEAGWGGYAVGNTQGILQGTRSCGNGCDARVYAIDGEERRGSFDFDVSRERLFNTEGVGRRAAEYAVNLLGAKKLDMTAKLPTIWTQIPAGLYILSSLAQSAVGRPVVDGVSPLCDKIGDTIANKDFTLIDNGQNPNSLETQSIDAEGLPQQINPIIERGVLKNFLFDSYFGKAFGLDSTGNCARGSGIFGGSMPYENRPGASSKFLEVHSGKKTEEDIISSIDGKAIMIRDFPLGIFHSSVETGEFSCVAGSAYLVEDGEVKGPVQPVSIAGNYYNGLKNLTDIANNQLMIPYGVMVPTLVFDDFSVVG